MNSQLVQPILVSKSGSHEEMIEAVARAALQVYRSGQGENWSDWLAGRFTKSVRRTGRKLEQLQIQLGGELVRCGEATALALPPMGYEEMPKSVREGQVAGTQRPPSGVWPHDEGGLRLWLNADLKMSTGKAAAQAAHGLMAWWLRANEMDRWRWQEGGEGLTIEAVSEQVITEALAVVEIHDAGWTEIAPDSLTVKVLGLVGRELR